MKKLRIPALLTAGLMLAGTFAIAGCTDSEDTVVLRIANWEEYIDEGDWDEDEAIDIENPYTDEDYIIGENSIVNDFVEWFNSQDYGFKVEVEYSTFGTNEDLYNQLSLGDVYDLVCPSDYMIMKLYDEGVLQEYSEEFFDTSIDTNYYINSVSSYIEDIFDENGWESIAACYMWGTTGFVYNPEELSDEDDVSTWSILINSDYYKSVTVKDNVRDTYFAALSILYKDELNAINANESMDDEEKAAARSELLNATDEETIAAAENILKEIKENVYSFETDSGKSDMVTGKVIANFQWSGDAVYIMDQADEDDTELWYSVPDESTNLWFDGWVMLKDGIDGSTQKQKAAEAFVNFISRPDIAIRNMYYIGYTSSIAADEVFEYLDWCYGVVTDEDDEEYYEIESVYAYDLSYFFGEDSYIYIDMAVIEAENYEATGKLDGYTIYSGGTISRGRQVFAQYPTEDVIERSVIMLDFGDELSAINQMWINVRCLDVKDINVTVVIVVAVIIVAIATAIVLYRYRYKIFYRSKTTSSDKKD